MPVSPKPLHTLTISAEDTPYMDLLAKGGEWTFDDEGELAVDVLETPTDIIVRSAIAGVRIEDLSIHVTNDTLTIRGTRHKDQTFSHVIEHVSECHWGGFSRTVILPHNVREDDAVAALKNGVLTILLPKSQSMTGEVPIVDMNV